MNNGQFLLKYNDFFKEHMISDDNEGKLYKLLGIYDDNYFITMKANERFKESLKKFKNSEGQNDSFSKSIDVLYDMNMYIRMLATVDDILIKISLYTYLVYKQNKLGLPTPKFESKTIQPFRNEIETEKLTKAGYPQLPDVNNRLTRKYRNDITHGNELMINKGIVKEKGLVTFIGPEGVYNRNNRNFDRVKKELESDLKVIDENQKIIEEKILSVLDVIKGHRY
ncbi:hypothetical protein [Staphylococcus gallinarum]|uniref:hypothetical protein n=1 Tax=Staphylococcus gallinarum TaxID=1293 RepID=UPI002DB661D5|nr:hypothetical protein [Staphylococcus gallinarum]MEB6277509.1 hypothetical protein [Staphylococcus gallinarum]